MFIYQPVVSLPNRLGKNLPLLTDYLVSIPPGGKTDALVETVITWNLNDKEFRTKGLDADQTESAIKATEKMLNIVENNEYKIADKLLANQPR